MNNCRDRLGPICPCGRFEYWNRADSAIGNVEDGDPAMMLSEYLKPALAVVVFAALGGGWYWFENRSHPEEKETPTNALVIVTKSTNACFSDVVRGSGYLVPRREAVVGVDQEGSKVTDVLVREGELVADNQELARLTAPPSQPGAPAGSRSGPTSL